MRISPIRAPEPGPTPNDPKRNAALGGADGLLALMRRLARESQHRELAAAPFLFWGWSAASAFGPSFALLHPERTVGFVRYHSGEFPFPTDVEALKEIPGLMFVGGGDGPEAATHAVRLFDQARSFAAPWAMVVQPHASHEIRATDIAAAARLTLPWIEAVVNARVRGGARLQPLMNAGGWLGDHASGGISRVSEADPSEGRRSWLPDERTATAWQSLAASAK